MMNNKTSVDLTPQEIEVIESALHTQEKILTVQSKAGGDRSAATRLSELQGVLRTVRRQNPVLAGSQGWGDMARAFFS